ncbi:HEAT repeat domain-containing protein [Thermoflavimicrobium daqui]|uniref:HEAT repeat domain-containing protein n=1 Tax=Thermoflavimicrobium daqui TaxID=2137476 RepID=A0A364K7L9_9BACL|nr:HEAT repeat domain-containing protein [Thermoflavimicrobium daqui]RAL26284.1 hypothetical protein DL897_04630 [Thermoflavimicrobium daqui]
MIEKGSKEKKKPSLDNKAGLSPWNHITDAEAKQLRQGGMVAQDELEAEEVYSISEFIQALFETNEKVRMTAAYRLSRMGKEAIEPLEACLQSDIEDVRFWAAWAITMIDPSQDKYVSLMIQQMTKQNHNRYIFVAATEALHEVMSYKASRKGSNKPNRLFIIK